MSSQNSSTSASSALLVRAQTWTTVILKGLPWKRIEIILSFLRLHPSTAFQTLLFTMMATPFLLRDSCPQQQIFQIYKIIGLSSVPGGSDGKASALRAGDPGLILGLGRSPGEGNGNPLQYSFFFFPFFPPVFLPGKFHGLRSLVGYSPWGLKESDTTERLHFSVYLLKVLYRLSYQIE